MEDPHGEVTGLRRGLRPVFSSVYPQAARHRATVERMTICRTQIPSACIS